MPSRLLPLLLLPLISPVSATSRVREFNGRGAAGHNTVPDARNHHAPVVQPRALGAGLEKDASFGPASTRISQQAGCFQSRWEEARVTGFLQDKLDALSADHGCWLQQGVAGLRVLLERNVTADLGRNVTLPVCPVNITSAGNAFSIDLPREEYRINGVSASALVLLTGIHLACMTLAFFVVYPVVLALSSATVLCELIDRPLYKKSIEKWQAILYLCFFVPLVAAGMACGVVGMGTSGHFRTEHGIIGLATVALATAAVCLYFVDRRMGGRGFLRSRWRWTRKLVTYMDMFVCQAVLLVSGFALSDGIDDFAAMSLCRTNTISTSLAFSLGMIVAFIWNGAMGAMAIQWWLTRRASPDQAPSRIKTWMWKIFRQPS